MVVHRGPLYADYPEWAKHAAAGLDEGLAEHERLEAENQVRLAALAWQASLSLQRINRLHLAQACVLHMLHMHMCRGMSQTQSQLSSVLLWTSTDHVLCSP